VVGLFVLPVTDSAQVIGGDLATLLADPDRFLPDPAEPIAGGLLDAVQPFAFLGLTVLVESPYCFSEVVVGE
jgi:hypothetical protein